jgi:hypothetical protein
METDEAVNGREPARMRMDRRIHIGTTMDSIASPAVSFCNC